MQNRFSCFTDFVIKIMSVVSFAQPISYFDKITATNDAIVETTYNNFISIDFLTEMNLNKYGTYDLNTTDEQCFVYLKNSLPMIAVPISMLTPAI